MGTGKAEFAVIFRARAGRRNGAYATAAERLRRRALEEYGCLEFTSVSEGGRR